MPTAKDVVDKAAIIQTSTGTELLRVFIVSELTGSAPVRMANALSAADIPQIGDHHAEIPSIRVTRRTVRPMGASTMEVIVTYSFALAEQLPPDVTQPAQLQITTSVRSEERTEDIFGEEIIVEHIFEEEDADGNTVLTPKSAVVPVTVQIPQPTLRLTRREPESPFIKSLVFVGSVNNALWNSAEPRTMLCTHLDGITDDGGETYQVSYEFQYNAGTWDAIVYFTDPDTGRPVEGLVEGVGIRRYEVYPEIDFGQLFLDV